LFCSHCGIKLNGGVRFCKNCGVPVGSPWPRYDRPEPHDDGGFYAQDIERNKGLAALSYIPFLFLLPLIACPESRYARFHANQGLVFLIAVMAWSIVFGAVSSILSFIWIVGPFITALLSLSWLLFMAWFMVGVINALGGRARPLPFIGGIRILS